MKARGIYKNTMPTTTHESRQLLCKGIAVCPYRHKSSQNFKYHFWPSPTGTSHPRKTWNRPLLKEQRRWNRNSALSIPSLAPLLSPPLTDHPSRCGIHCTFLEASLEKKRCIWIFSHFTSSKQTQPDNLLNSLFVINTWQGHFKSPSFFFCLVLFFPPRMKRALLPLRVYVPLFHWHWFPCHRAQLISNAWNLSSLHIATGVYFLSSFPGIASLFWKTKDPASTATLLTTYFRMTSDPGGLHFSSALACTVITQDSPLSRIPSPVDCRGCHWIDKILSDGHPCRALWLWKPPALHLHDRLQIFTEETLMRRWWKHRTEQRRTCSIHLAMNAYYVSEVSQEERERGEINHVFDSLVSRDWKAMGKKKDLTLKNWTHRNLVDTHVLQGALTFFFFFWWRH